MGSAGRRRRCGSEIELHRLRGRPDRLRHGKRRTDLVSLALGVFVALSGVPVAHRAVIAHDAAVHLGLSAAHSHQFRLELREFRFLSGAIGHSSPPRLQFNNKIAIFDPSFRLCQLVLEYRDLLAETGFLLDLALGALEMLP